MTTTVTTVTESVTPVTVIVIQSQLLSSSHSYRHNAAIPAARATCGQHKGPNMMMFSPLYQQRSAAASKLRVRNIQPGPARTGLEQLAPVRNLQSGTIRTSQNQSEPVWNSLSRSETSSLEQSDSNRFRPIQLSPKHPARTSQNQSGPVWTGWTGLEQLKPVRNLQSGTIRLKPVQNGWLRLHSSVRLPTAPRSRLRCHRRFRHERIRQAQPEQ